MCLFRLSDLKSCSSLSSVIHPLSSIHSGISLSTQSYIHSVPYPLWPIFTIFPRLIPQTMCPRLQNCFLEYESESLRPTLLGKDGLGNALFHFPLWPEEVRVYMEICPTENNSDYPNTDYVSFYRKFDDLLRFALRKSTNILQPYEYV